MYRCITNEKAKAMLEGGEEVAIRKRRGGAIRYKMENGIILRERDEEFEPSGYTTFEDLCMWVEFHDLAFSVWEGDDFVL